MDINEEAPLISTTDRTTPVDTNPVATTTGVVITGTASTTTSTPGTGLGAVLKSATVSPPSYCRSISSPAVTGGRKGLQLRDTPQDNFMSTQQKQVKSNETCYVRGLNRSGGDCMVSTASRERLKQQEPLDSQMSTLSDAAVGRYSGTSFTVVSPNFNFCGESLNTKSGDSHDVFWFTASPSKGDRDMKEEEKEEEGEGEGEVVKSKPLALVHSRGEGREEGRVMGEGGMCEDEREGNEEVAALAQQLQLDSDNVN